MPVSPSKPGWRRRPNGVRHVVKPNTLGLYDVHAPDGTPVQCDFGSRMEAEAFAAECDADVGGEDL